MTGDRAETREIAGDEPAKRHWWRRIWEADELHAPLYVLLRPAYIVAALLHDYRAYARDKAAKGEPNTWLVDFFWRSWPMRVVAIIILLSLALHLYPLVSAMLAPIDYHK